MTDYDTPRGGRMRLARTRGMTSGVLLIVLGAWAAIVPFIGDYFDFAYTPTSTWTWTAARGWYEVLPGAVAVLGGLLLLFSANRMVTLVGAWIAAAAGAWLVIGPQLAPSLSLGTLGVPANTSTSVDTAERLFYFYAVGAAILFVASVALGRLSVRSIRDIRVVREEAAAQERAAAAPRQEPVPAAATRTETAANRHHHRHFQFLHRHRDEEPEPAAQVYGPEGQPVQQTTTFPPRGQR